MLCRNQNAITSIKKWLDSNEKENNAENLSTSNGINKINTIKFTETCVSNQPLLIQLILSVLRCVNAILFDQIMSTAFNIAYERKKRWRNEDGTGAIDRKVAPLSFRLVDK